MSIFIDIVKLFRTLFCFINPSADISRGKDSPLRFYDTDFSNKKSQKTKSYKL